MKTREAEPNVRFPVSSTQSTESWDHVSPGPDHSDIRSKWDIDPKRWVVQWKPRDATEDAYREVGIPAWSSRYSYRMRLLPPTVVGVVPSRPRPQAGEVDPLGKDAHEPGGKLDAGDSPPTNSPREQIQFDQVFWPAHYNQGDIECIDAMIAAYGIEKVKTYCTLAAFKYQWRCFEKESEERDRAKAIWYMRFAAGDDPRKDRV